MASKLPQKKGANLSFGEHCSTCGSWLACDASDAIYRLNPVDAIASKPAPTTSLLLLHRRFFSARRPVLAHSYFW